MQNICDDYTVIFELSVTAKSPEEAAKFALDDLRDESIGPWNAFVNNTDLEENKVVVSNVS